MLRGAFVQAHGCARRQDAEAYRRYADRITPIVHGQPGQAAATVPAGGRLSASSCRRRFSPVLQRAVCRRCAHWRAGRFSLFGSGYAGLGGTAVSRMSRDSPSAQYRPTVTSHRVQRADRYRNHITPLSKWNQSSIHLSDLTHCIAGEDLPNAEPRIVYQQPLNWRLRYFCISRSMHAMSYLNGHLPTLCSPHFIPAGSKFAPGFLIPHFFSVSI